MGYVTLWPRLVPGTAPHVFELAPQPALGVRVLEAGTSAPITGARVHARRVDPPWDPVDDELVSDAAGRVELAGVAPDVPFEIAVVAEGFATIVARQLPTSDRSAPLAIVLGGGGELVGTVSDEEGRLEPHAEVFVAAVDAPTPLRAGDRWDAAENAFRRRIPAARWLLQAHFGRQRFVRWPSVTCLRRGGR